jgi:hypothetical protein
LVAEFFFSVPTDCLEPGKTVNGINSQAETIHLVVNGQLHWGVDVALLLVPAHVYSFVPTSVGQAMDQPGIAVKIENDRFIAGEKRVEVRVGQTVRMFRARL